MDYEGTLNELIEDIYASSLANEEPSPLLGRIAAFLGFEVAAVVTARSRYEGATCEAAWGIDLGECQRAEREYNVCMSAIRVLGRELQAGEIAFGDELISDAALIKEPYYREFLLPNRIDEGMKICLENSPERLVFAVLARPVPDADRERQRRLAGRLASHWARASRIHHKMQQVDVLRHAYSDVVNMSPLPMVVFDNGGMPYLLNKRAEQFLKGDGLSMQGDMLTAAQSAENQRLQQAIREVVNCSIGASAPLRGADITITRPSGKRSLQLVVVPLSPGYRRTGRRPAAVLIVFDPEGELEVSLQRCSEVFGFTRAEAQVAVGMMRGQSLEQISVLMGHSLATSRNLLKRVYQKAGVNRQNELTRVMLYSPLFIDPGNLQAVRLDTASGNTVPH